MPKGKVKTIDVNKRIFIAVIRTKGYSIRKLCESFYLKTESDMCSERTLRRALDNGKIRSKYVESISKILDVDPRYLTGNNTIISSINYKLRRFKSIDKIPLSYYLAQINEYPYSREKLDELRQKSIKEHLENILSLFEFSYSQFETLDFDHQYNFQHELFESIIPVLDKYFKKDAYGNPERPALDTLILSLENYYEDECILRYADTITRENFILSPPEGYTSAQIRKMSRQEIFDLDFSLQWDDDEN